MVCTALLNKNTNTRANQKTWYQSVLWAPLLTPITTVDWDELPNGGRGQVPLASLILGSWKWCFCAKNIPLWLVWSRVREQVRFLHADLHLWFETTDANGIVQLVRTWILWIHDHVFNLPSEGIHFFPPLSLCRATGSRIDLLDDQVAIGLILVWDLFLPAIIFTQWKQNMLSVVTVPKKINDICRNILHSLAKKTPCWVCIRARPFF